MNDEGPVAIFADHLIEKTVAGAALLIKHAGLAPAGVHKKTKCQWQIRLATEVMDGLNASVLSQSEVVLGQIVNDFAVLVPDCGQDIHYIDLDGDRGSGIGRLPRRMASLLLRRSILGDGEAG